MSVELRINDEFKCECDWGVVEYTRAYPPDRVGHLILVDKQGLIQLLHGHAEGRTWSGTPHATEVDGHLFFHLEHDGQRWTWELFDAHWADYYPDNVYIGRWPD